MSQSGKIALVTGGAQGIGRTFTESLLAEGASVAVCDLKRQVGEAAVKDLSVKYGNKVIFLECDVTNDKQFEECFMNTKEKFSGLDLVINNAGVLNEKDGGWQMMVDTNFSGVVRGSYLGMKYMSKQNGGRGGTIVNIASVSYLEPFPTLPVYSATKAAINQFSRSYGNDLYYLKSGVKVISVNPGYTKTMMTDNLTEGLRDKDVIDDYLVRFNEAQSQNISNMGNGLIEVLQKGLNGSIWIIENDQPARLNILNAIKK